MGRKRNFAGEVRQYSKPDWTALEDLIGIELAGWFMWMHEIELDDGAAVHAYKHKWTRRYLHLSEDGRAFLFVDRGRYRRIDQHDAITGVFNGWLGEETDDGCKPTYIERLAFEVALRRARRSGV
jgi:hypothetical protein